MRPKEWSKPFQLNIQFKKLYTNIKNYIQYKKLYTVHLQPDRVMLNTMFSYTQWQTLNMPYPTQVKVIRWPTGCLASAYGPISTLHPTLHQIHSSYHERFRRVTEEGGTRWQRSRRPNIFVSQEFS